jgi:glucokinase
MIVLLPGGVLHSADMAGASRVLVGVDIGGTKTAIVAGTVHAEGLRIIDRRALSTEPATRSWRETLDMICAEARALLKERAQGRRPDAVGVSCGGPLDSRSGTLLSPPNLPGWDRVPIVDEMGKALGCPAFLKNDANACALAEWRFGAGRGTRNMVFLTFGTGMGAGLILDGRLYEGTSDLGGEVGHIRLAEDGPVGYGKAGSFEGFCSGGGIARLARAEAEKWLAAGRDVSFCPNADALQSITAKGVGEAAEAGDPLAREVLAATGRYLGRGLSLLMDILNPQRIVIGSIFVRCRSFLQPAMDAEIEAEALPGAARVCDVVPAALGESIGDHACLSVAVDGLARKTRGARAAIP